MARCASCTGGDSQKAVKITGEALRDGSGGKGKGSGDGGRGGKGIGKGGGGGGWGGGGGQSPSPLALNERPQRPVPGFDHLTVCRDWPQTKKGEPPSAQSGIFCPLLGCVLGPVEGYCTQADIDTAMMWWTLALPAWPRWVEELVAGGLPGQRTKLLASAKGNPNPLIPKSRGRGTVPHIRGRLQVDALEDASPMVALELMACVTCLYSAEALDRAEGGGRNGGASEPENRGAVEGGQ